MLRELSLHVLDIVENSLNAGATLVTIEVSEDTREDVLIIRVADNGYGMDADALKRASDPFFTTRTTRRVGLGLPFLKQAAEMCNGRMSVESQPGDGTIVTATFQHSHLNRMPLGDLAGTVLTLVIGNPETDFVFRHHVNDEAFEFDTRPIKAVLGDVPLSDPAVIAYLKQALGI